MTLSASCIGPNMIWRVSTTQTTERVNTVTEFQAQVPCTSIFLLKASSGSVIVVDFM